MPTNNAAVLDPIRPPANPPPVPEPLAPLVGACVAEACAILLQDMVAYDQGTRPEWRGQRTAGGDALADLLSLREAALATGELGAPFESVARVFGSAELSKRAKGRLSENMVNLLIDGILECLDRVVAVGLH